MGRPPAAFWGKLLPFPKKGFSRVWTLERVRAEPAVLPAGWLRGFGGLMERRRVCFRSSGAPARPFLMGKPFLHPTLPRDTPKIRRATLKRFCPAGANSVDPAHRQHILAPRGKDASFPSPPNLPFRIGGLFPAQPRRRERQKKAQTSPFQKGRKSSSALAPSIPSNSNRSAPRPRERRHRAPVRRISLY